MKHQFFTGFLMAFLCASTIIFAQEPNATLSNNQKPLLFANLPLKQICNRSQLEKLIHALKADHISITLNDFISLSGEVTESVKAANGIHNVNIRLSNFGNALLNISIFSQPDNTNKIVGRIIHPRHGDALIISEEQGKYYITKHKMEFLMVE